MKRILAVSAAVFCFSVMVGPMAFAGALKEVYLKDGGIIECQKAWKTNGKIMVLVNRDVLLDFSRDEVDLKKTFGKKTAKVRKKRGKKLKNVSLSQKPVARKSAAKPLHGVVTSVKEPAKPVQAVKPVQAANPAQAPHPPQPASVAPPAKPVAKVAAQVGAPATKKPGQPATPPRPEKTAPKPAVQPPQPPAEPAFSLKNPMMLQAACGGALIVLLAALLVMRRKRGK